MKQASLTDFAPEIRPTTPPPSSNNVFFKVMVDIIVHPLIAKDAVEYRAFQLHISLLALEQSTLVCIPTRFRQTVIAALIATDVIQHGADKAFFNGSMEPMV